MLALLYTSTSRLGADPRAALDAIVAAAVRRNLSSGVTGALVHTGTHFAQALEGPEPVVRALMERITADPRHADIRVIRSGPQAVRRFPNWGMALVDAEPRVQALIEQAAGDRDWAAGELITAMERGASPVL